LHLTPSEQDRLLLFAAAELARRRRADGVLLNVPESTALVADEVCEVARRGGRHADAVRRGRSVLSAEDVLPEVPHLVRTVSVEAVFADGSRLVVVDAPFGPVPDRDDMPGSVIQDEDARETHDQAPTDRLSVRVENTAPVPISVTSHFHFFEVNPRLRFSRASAFGRHLDVAAGTQVRFEPGTVTEVDLVPIGGHRVVTGFAGLIDGALDEPGMLSRALARAHAWGFLDADLEDGSPADPSHAASRATRHARQEWR
jgi:urease subunit gamma/beta